MAHTKNPLLYPEIFFDMLSSARHNTWQPHHFGFASDAPWTYNKCRDLQHKFAGFRSALLHASCAACNTLAQQLAYRSLHHISQGIKTSITRSPDRIHATLTFTYFSATRKLSDLLTAPLADPIPEAVLDEFAKSPMIADLMSQGRATTRVTISPDGITREHIPYASTLNAPSAVDCVAADCVTDCVATQTPPTFGKIPTPFDDVNPTIDEYEQHRVSDLRDFRLALVERIKRGILTYQISHPSLMGNPSIDFTPALILATLTWMAANTDYRPSLDCAEALTDLITFNADNPNLPTA